MEPEQQEQLQRKVVQVFQYVVEELAKLEGTPSVQKLERFVAACRGKLLVHERKPLHGAITAFCVALEDCDYICECADVEQFLAEYSVTHELGHLLFNHISRVSVPQTLKEFQRISSQEFDALYRGRKVFCHGGDLIDSQQSAFSHPAEFVAEKFAALYMEYLEQQQFIVPSKAIHAFGG